jgi:hypothetical protein
MAQADAGVNTLSYLPGPRPLSDQEPHRPREISTSALRVSVVDDICGGQTVEHGVNVRRLGGCASRKVSRPAGPSKSQTSKTKSGF